MHVQFLHRRIPVVAVLLAVCALTAGAFYFFNRTIPGQAAVQTGYRWRNDDGTEATASFAAAEGSSVTVTKDLATPADPETTGTVAINDSGGTGPQDIAVYGDFAYVPSGISGSDELAIVNVSDPSNPTIESQTVIAGMNFVSEIAVQFPYAYIGDSASGRLHVIDVTDPTAPAEVGVLTDPALAGGGTSLAVQGHYAYAASGGGDTFKIIDISDPTAPVALGSVSVTDPLHMEILGRYVYVLSTDFVNENVLTVIDVNDPYDPVVVGTVDDSADAFSSANLAVFGTHVFVSAADPVTFDPLIRIFDVSDPTNPVVVGTFIGPSGDFYQDLDIIGHTLYAASALHLIDDIDVTDPTAPALISSTAMTGVISDGFFNRINVEGDYAYLTDVGSTSQLLAAQIHRSPIERLRFEAANSGSESEFAETNAVSFATGEDQAYGAVIDTAHGFAYVGDCFGTDPSKILKIRLSDMTEVASLTLGAGQVCVSGADIDPGNNVAYFVTQSSPAYIAKVDLTTFTEVDSLAFPTEALAFSIVLDLDNQFAYVAAYQSALGKIVKIDLSSFAYVGNITLADTMGPMESSFIDPVAGVAYFLGDINAAPNTGMAARVDLATFTQTGSLTFTAGENIVNGAAIDLPNGLLYAATTTGQFVKVDLGTFTEADSFDLSDMPYPYTMTIDHDNQFAYVGGIGPNLTKVDLSTFSESEVISLSTGDSSGHAMIDTDSGFAYFGAFTIPGALAKVSIAPRASFQLEYGAKTSTCAAISSWIPVPVGATNSAQAWEMAPSANLIRQETTTNVAGGLTDGNDSFKAGAALDDASITNPISLGELQFSEIEYALRATANAVAGQRYCFRLTDAGDASAFTFDSYGEARIAGGSSGGGGGGGVVTPSVTVTDPNGGETLVAGSKFPITWNTSGRVDLVNIAYSADDGANWYAIATNAVNTGTFSWTVTNVTTSLARIRVEATDTAVVFASDVSDGLFTITGTQPPPPPPGTESQQPVPAGTLVLSPFSGLPEAVDTVHVGDYVRSPHYRGIYYVTDQFDRRPFSYASLFFTYETDLSKVREVSDATLSTLPEKSAMPPKAGTVLLRFDGEPGIYGVFPGPNGQVDPLLRHIDSESLAVQLYGPAWKSYVLDLDNLFFGDYSLASPLITFQHVPTSGLLSRDYLHAKVVKYMAALMKAGYSSGGRILPNKLPRR